MLDDNTNKLYWVVGAVLIVGALVVAAQAFFPDLFDKAGDAIEGKLPA